MAIVDGSKSVIVVDVYFLTAFNSDEEYSFVTDNILSY